MGAALRHRGPDSAASGSTPQPGWRWRIGGWRSSISRPTAHQPMVSAERPLRPHLQRRDLQSSAPAARAASASARGCAGTPIPRSCWRRSRPGAWRRALERRGRHVRLRAVGPAHRHAHAGARPLGQEAALFRPHRSDASLSPRSSRRSPPIPTSRPRWTAARSPCSCATSTCRRRTRSSAASSSCRPARLLAVDSRRAAGCRAGPAGADRAATGAPRDGRRARAPTRRRLSGGAALDRAGSSF